MWLGITASCSKLHAYALSRQAHFQAAMQPFICLQDQRGSLSTQETPLLQKHNQLKRVPNAQGWSARLAVTRHGC